MLLLAAVCVWWWNLLPEPLFDVPYSTVLLDRDDRIIGLKVAGDGQFRMPGVTPLSAKYTEALMTFEDRRFPLHPGVDPAALCRALFRNIRAGSVVSGGSTLTMQLIRLARKNPPRTYPEKLWEMLLALRIESTVPKYRILQYYAAHAPFGKNIVGIEAAALKYFGRTPLQLSWAEAALLAVLPNAPSLNSPELLKSKRDRLLEKLHRKGSISGEDYTLAVTEPIPRELFYPESVAPHLLGVAGKNRNSRMSRSTLDTRLQKQVNAVVSRHSRMLGANHIYNLAVLVAHIPSGEVRAYVGNSPPQPGSRGNDVDIITSARSSGSILKPALYALMQQNGYLLPETLIPDIPSRFGTYMPSNFSRNFQGAVPAGRALAVSLNIPFVRMLQAYGYLRFYNDLQRLGITTLNREADHYGLSLILGGAETSLWDLCNLYGGMAATLRHYGENDGDYFRGEYGRLHVWREDSVRRRRSVVPKSETPLHASAVWHTFRALKDVERPELESGWKTFASGMDLAWKTGTSFGFRDAWAVGVNADWVVGVWAGNADGEGRPGLVGVRVAAPVLFEVAGLLPVTAAFYEPAEEMSEAAVCRQSGYRASLLCPDTDTLRVCRSGANTEHCPFHRQVHLDASGTYRVTSDCERLDNIRVTSWFVLPPVQEWYYTQTHSDYRKLPPWRPDCRPEERDVMEMIYPRRGTRVFIPRDFGGERGKVVFELAHRRAETEVYWHIDEQYAGATRFPHQMELYIGEGPHLLTLVDRDGNTLQQHFTVVGK
jgi:penicillin-binding protein 1C